MTAPTQLLDWRLMHLADGRFPSGGYAHSSGVEAAVADGSVGSLADLESFLTGWLNCGLGAEARLSLLASDSNLYPDSAALGHLDDLAEAAQPSPALRRTGRRLGKTLLRTSARTWPGDHRLGDYYSAVSAGAAVGQHPVAMGVAVAACLGGEIIKPNHELAAPLTYGFSSISGAAWSAVRLLPVDPLEISALLVRLWPLVQEAATRATGSGALPAAFAPAYELRAEDHATWEVRLFAS